MWFVIVEVEQETSSPPPKKNPGSAPVCISQVSKIWRLFSAAVVVFVLVNESDHYNVFFVFLG